MNYKIYLKGYATLHNVLKKEDVLALREYFNHLEQHDFFIYENEKRV